MDPSADSARPDACFKKRLTLADGEGRAEISEASNSGPAWVCGWPCTVRIPPLGCRDVSWWLARQMIKPGSLAPICLAASFREKKGSRDAKAPRGGNLFTGAGGGGGGVVWAGEGDRTREIKLPRAWESGRVENGTCS